MGWQWMRKWIGRLKVVQKLNMNFNKFIISYHTTPHHTTPHQTTPHQTTPHQTHHTTTHHTTPHHTTPHHTLPHPTTPHHTIPNHTTSHHTTPRHTTPRQLDDEDAEERLKYVVVDEEAGQVYQKTQYLRPGAVRFGWCGVV